ncbi:multi-sensor hybrid histidine kinase [Magnetococcus marinus MC-1]|uniref:Sensory/regulatory protein RpfC n=1 Tax=Magnetococcus marinus (strain ATCC BAA-1437 / JCM 17883 / MC-1) TaxID=156889 RepID=A0LAA1_MAGMM|nr:transporter substrate-binding domain-containing protein [Magnetococcus marinus]ABK44894.1 multi-sensor hybrid histidine kinase [Magnetococcus marinus MC-1]
MSHRWMIWASLWLWLALLGTATAAEGVMLNEAERAWLAEHPVVRVGMDPAFAPYSFIEDGRYQGIVPEMLQALAAETGLVFETVAGLSWSEILAGAKARHLDLVASLVQTPERDRFLQYTQIYLPTPLVVMARNDDSSMSSAADLVGKRVALVRDYATSAKLLQEHPESIPYMVESVAQGLLAVSVGQADAFVGAIGVSDYTARQKGLSNLKVVAPYGGLQYGQRFGVRKDWPLLVSILEKGLASMTEKQKIALFDRWLPVQNQLHPAPVAKIPVKLQLAPHEQAWLSNHPKIRIGVMRGWPPIDFADAQGRPQGIGTDTVHLLDEMLGGGVLEIVSDTWPTLYQQVIDKKLDGLMGITPTEARRPFFEFTAPYMTIPHAIFARSDAPYATGLKSLQGKTVVVEKHFFVADLLRHTFPSIKILERRDTREALYAVSKGDAYAYVGNRAVATYIIDQEIISNVQEMGIVRLSRSDNAIGVRKDWPILRDVLQKGLSQITMAQKREMAAKWVKGSVQAPLELPLTKGEQRWLSEHPQVRLGVRENWAPYDYQDRAGFQQGIAADYVALLDRYLTVTMKMQHIRDDSEWVRIKDTLDVLTTLTPQSAKSTGMLPTSSYLRLPLVMMMRRASPLVEGIEDLKGRTISVVQGVVDTYALAKRYPWVMWRNMATTEQALQALAQGEVTAHLDTIPAVRVATERLALDSLQVVTPTDLQLQLSFGVRPDWPELVSIINKVMQAVPPAEKRVIVQSWMRPRTQTAMDWIYLWKVVGTLLLLAAVVLGVVLVWNRRLSQEIEQRKRVEEELSKLYRAVEQTPVSVVITDLEGRVEYVNPTFCHNSGFAEDEVLGRTNGLIPSDHTSGAEYQALWQQITAGGEWSGEFLNRTKSGGLVWERVSISAVRSADGQITHYLGIKEDISQMKEDQERLAHAKESADLANRAKSSFLANMSHEIRTPINAIVGMCHLAQRMTVEPKLRDYLGHIQVAADTLLGIINDILDVSKIEAGKLHFEDIPFKLDELISRVMRLQGLKAQDKNVELVIDLEPQVPQTVVGDPLRISQILTNLVNNAVKFTEQGEVVLSVKLQGVFDGRVTLYFEVRDSGIGMEDAQLQRLFTPFQQGDDSMTRRYGGTGLGLSICQNLVKMMGGHLQVESRLSEGSRFYFTVSLPIHQAPALERVDQTSLNLRVLVVDDNQTVREVLQRMLKSFGYWVDLAAEGPTGVALVESALQQGQPYDLILMDWHMPQMDGLQASEQIRHLQGVRAQRTPVMIMAAAYGQEDSHTAVSEPGFAGFLEKPTTPANLFGAIMIGLHGAPQEAPSGDAGWGYTVPDLSGYRVLLVEDHPINQALAREMLSLAKLQVITADHGQHALDLLQEASVDLIFMDIQMPVMDGFSATQAIRADPRWQHIPIIAMTAHAMADDRQKCLDGGMNDHLGKPIDPPLLFAKITQWLGPQQRGRASHDAARSGRAPVLMGRRILMALGGGSLGDEIEQMLQQSGALVEQLATGREDLNRWQPEVVLVDRQGYESLSSSPLPRCYTVLVEHEGHATVERPVWADDWLLVPVEGLTLMATLQHALRDQCAGTTEGGADADAVVLPQEDRHFYLRWALAQGAGNRVLLRRLLQLFVEDHARDLELLGAMIARGAMAEVAALAHRLAGVAGGMGAMKLYALAKRMERHGEQARPLAISRLYPLLAEEMEAVLERLQTLGGAAVESPSQAQGALLDRGEMLEKLVELKRLIDGGQTDAVERAEELQGGVLEERFKKDLDQVKHLLQDYEFEAASKHLDAAILK